MKYLNLKVLLETKDTVYCDFLVNETDNLKALFDAIIAGFHFKGDQMASFIKESDGWQAAEEFHLESVGNPDEKLMESTHLSELFKEEGDQLTLIYDYLNEWKFHIELIEVIGVKVKQETPKLVKSFGKPPKEAERSLSGTDAESILMNAILGDEFNEEDGDDYDDPFENGDYESLDDYEEYQ